MNGQSHLVPETRMAYIYRGWVVFSAADLLVTVIYCVLTDLVFLVSFIVSVTFHFSVTANLDKFLPVYRVHKLVVKHFIVVCMNYLPVMLLPTF